MFSYVALVWDASSAAKCLAASALSEHVARSPAWRPVLESRGLTVFCSGIRKGSSEALLLPAGAGVVLGMLFDRTCATHSDLPRRASLDDKSAAAIRQTNGRELLHAFWGRYVAFLPGPGGLVRVIRDPTGELDCLTMNIGGVRVFFNFVDQCPLLEGQKLSVNWDYVASAAAVYLPETLETGFIEITRVLRGECLEVCERGLRRQLYWDPSAFAAEGGFDDVRVAESAMFRTASHCINAWASCYGGVIPLLSGGLDSSILLGLLMQSPHRPPVTALTYYYLDGSGSDERYYARASAAHAGSRLIEHEINPGCSFENLLQMPKQSGDRKSVV